MKITKHELGHGVFIEPTSELETFLTWKQLQELYKTLDKFLWEEDTKIHNENIKQKS